MSMDNPYFPNGRVSVLSTKLLTAEKFIRIAESGTLAAAVKILYECGYGGGAVLSSPSEYELLLQRELTNAVDFVKSMTSDTVATDCLLLQYDYLNAKMIVKAIETSKDALALCSHFGTIPVEKLIDKIVNRKYDTLPIQMANALTTLSLLDKEGKLTPFAVDSVLDKAMYENITANAQKCSHKVIADYYKAKIDTLNVLAAFRCIKVGLSKDFYAQILLPCGTIDDKTLLGNFADSAEKTALGYKRTKYGELASRYAAALTNGQELAECEIATANFLKNILKPYNLNNDKITPLINYYLSKTTEIDNLRMILMCLKNKIDSTTIKQRIKELYV